MNNIILIGMTGAGKTTVGRYISRKWDLDFYDTDQLISEKENMSPREIVSTKGRDYFINIQTEVILNINVENSVISTGGSVVESEIVIEKLRELGKLYYLDIDFETLEDRIDKSRPLAGNSDKTFYELFREREILYKKYADMICNCRDKTVDQISTWIKQKHDEVNRC